MTIRQFAALCSCNPQTLRYYDRVGLLKPAKVDPWTGYRSYEEEQALSFVKIRSLQKAGFTIGEIRELLDKDHPAVLEALRSSSGRRRGACGKFGRSVSHTRRK